ncbi:MAG: ATP-dependent DNA helicase RecG, partial [Oscillospiraceae bacterium]|nr:ATP-dependent DNA helicase RecG [Oscillospiraceae bacterium]
MVTLSTEIKYLKGVGEKRAGSLQKQNIHTVSDLLRNYPRGYEDWNSVVTLRSAEIGETVCVSAIVCERPQLVRINGGKFLVKTVIGDGTDYIP